MEDKTHTYHIVNYIQHEEITFVLGSIVWQTDAEHAGSEGSLSPETLRIHGGPEAIQRCPQHTLQHIRAVLC